MTQEKRVPRGAQAVSLPSFFFTFSESLCDYFEQFLDRPLHLSSPRRPRILRSQSPPGLFSALCGSPHGQAHVFSLGFSLTFTKARDYFSLVSKNEQNACRMILIKKEKLPTCLPRPSWSLLMRTCLMDIALSHNVLLNWLTSLSFQLCTFL